MHAYHPTIESFFNAIKSNNVEDLKSIFDENIIFKPPTYWKEWQGKEVVARILSHVNSVFKNLEYKRVLSNNTDYFLEFSCKIDHLDATGVDMIFLNKRGLIEKFEVVMRPYKSVGELRKSMTLLTSNDPFFQSLQVKK
ncbi:nuclear transport factor 2 family protein [Paracoccaceae bacterium]|nr:nuclear transport factor 2 family protein [Paracoccaceae bacterium]